jgi:dienelactone hydrolase
VTAGACDDGSGGAASAPDSEPSENASATASNSGLEPLPTGRVHAVGYRDVTLVDDSRPTDKNGSFEGTPDRTLPTRVWYPAEGAPGGEAVEGAPVAASGGPFPLVVFGHGFRATQGADYYGLLTPIAARGYVVAAPTFPLTNRLAPGGPNTLDVESQPGDVSFLFDAVPELPRIGVLIDPERLGVAGHSLGAITALAVALNDCCLDERVDAAVSYAGLTESLDGSDPFAGEAPVLLVHGDQDLTIEYRGSTDAFAAAAAPKYLLTLLGFGHYSGYLGGDSPEAVVVLAGTVDFLDAYLKGDDAALERLAVDGDVPGVSTLQAEP